MSNINSNAIQIPHALVKKFIEHASDKEIYTALLQIMEAVRTRQVTYGSVKPYVRILSTELVECGKLEMLENLLQTAHDDIRNRVFTHRDVEPYLVCLEQAIARLKLEMLFQRVD